MSRLLTDPKAPNAQAYEIQRNGRMVAWFLTGGVNGKTPDETALANLADWSDQHQGAWSLWKQGRGSNLIRLAVAEQGCTELEWRIDA